jgi:hypothetical protein
MKENSRRKSRSWIWVAAVFFVLLLVIGTVTVYINKKWKPLLTQELKAEISNSSNHLYQLNFKDLRLNVITGTAVLDSVSLTPDLKVFEKLKKMRIAPTHLFNIKLASLKVNRIAIYDAYFKKDLKIASIVLDRPSINMIYNKVSRQKDSVNVERDLYQQISKTLKSVSVSKIRVINADFDYVSGATGLILNAVKHLNINVDDFLVDSVSRHDPKRFYYAKDASFELAGYESLTKDKMYTLKVDTVTGSATGQSIRVKGFRLIPMYADIAFSNKYKFQKDRYDLKFSQVNITGVNFNKLNQDGIFHAKSIRIGPAKVAVFLNRNLPPANVNKGNNFPHMALRKLAVPIVIDTLKLNKINIAYTELDPITLKKGTLTLNQLSGKVLNLTNDSLQLSKNDHALAHVNTLIQNAIPTEVKINFDLKAVNGAFTYQGTIGEFDMKLLNPLSRSLGLVEIETGSVQKATFKMQGNKTGASGTVHFNYNNLKVNLLKEGEDGALKAKGLLSFIANALIVKDSNPSKNDAPRTANVKYERAAGASFFNLMWKGVFVGIRDIVGLGVVPMKSQAEMQKKIADKKEQREKRRQKRADKKEKRIEKKYSRQIERNANGEKN